MHAAIAQLLVIAVGPGVQRSRTLQAGCFGRDALCLAVQLQRTLLHCESGVVRLLLLLLCRRVCTRA